VKADYWAIFDDIEAEPGDAAVGVARRRVKVIGRLPGERRNRWQPSQVRIRLDPSELPFSTPGLTFSLSR
jgi:hypothetical protein